MQPRAIIPLAWRNLTENKRRLLVSVVGTAFAVTLMFMQNGFRHALLDSMVNLIEQFDGQVVITSRTLYTLAVPFSFPYRRLVQGREFPEVTGTSPIYVSTRMGYWRNPADGSLGRICVVGIRPEDDVLKIDEVKAHREELRQVDTALADELSRTSSFGTFTPGMVSELSGQAIRIIGLFELGINGQSNGNLITSERTFLRIFPDQAGATEGDHRVTVGMLRVRPGTDLDQLQAKLAKALPPDVRVLSLAKFIARERDFWDKVAPVGTVFSIGVVMGFIVGSVICYQVLFSDISDRIGEFATLKAIGYSNFRLFRVPIMQGLYLAILGYLAGLAVSMLLFHWVHEATGLPVDLSRNDPLFILGLTIAMCTFSAAYAARRLISVDPAQLFA